MRRTAFGEPVVPADVEQLPAEAGAVEFVRLCTAIISRALSERLRPFTIPNVSEPVHVPDGGIDAEFVSPESSTLEETGGLVGPGRTIFQFKYRDVTRRPRNAIIRQLSQSAREEFARVSARCDRYVFMTNIQLAGAQSRNLREAILSSLPSAAQKFIVVWGATEIAHALNGTPDLRHLFFARGGLSTLAIAEQELKAAYAKIAWPDFVGRTRELKDISDFATTHGPGVLQVRGPKLVGKTRLVLEALSKLPIASSVIWAASPQYATLDLFRDLDQAPREQLLVVDRCDDFSAPAVVEWALTRQRLKTIIIREADTQRELPGLLTQLEVGPLSQEETARLIAASSNDLPWLQESWLTEVSGGLPGLLVYLLTLIATSRTAGIEPSPDVREALGKLLRDRYVVDLTNDAIRVLQAASLLTVLGIEGGPGKELAAVCRALDLSPQSFNSWLPELERRNLLQRRGRFVEVVPPVLGEYIAGQALMNPERVLSELELEFTGEPGAFYRALERLRNVVSNPEVQRAIRSLFSESGWFIDIVALVRNAKKFEILAPAAPIEATDCVWRLLRNKNADELRSRISGEARRAFVWALDRLSLRSDTFDRASRLLFALADAENESWTNNATGVWQLLFHWQHPEAAASYNARVRVLRDLAASEAPSRRRLVAAACGGAFKEHVSIALHQATGPEVPEPPFRPATWTDVRSYAAAVLQIIVQLTRDEDDDVRQTAVTSLLDAFHTLVLLSLSPERVEPFGMDAIRVVEEVGRRTRNADARMRVVRRVDFVLERLKTADEPAPAAELRQRLEQTIRSLTEGDFLARLWAAVGPPTWGNRRRLDRDSTDRADLEHLAQELVSDQDLVSEHFEWLMSSDAKSAPQLFVAIGALDTGGRIWRTLLEITPKTGQWSAIFAAYVEGWSHRSLPAAEDALEDVQERDPDVLEGATIANRILPQSPRTIRRLLTAIRRCRLPRPKLAELVAGAAQWTVIESADMKAVLEAVDDGTLEVRRSLLHPFAVRLARGGVLSNELEELAWRFVETAVPAQEPGWYVWDDVVSHLASRDPDRAIGLLRRAFNESRRTGRRMRLDAECPLTWAVLLANRRESFVAFLLSLVLESDSFELQFTIAEVLDPRVDAKVIRNFIEANGVLGAKVIAETLDPDRPGYFELVPEVIKAASGDSQVELRLRGRLFSGSWSGSAVPMIRKRIESLRALREHSDSRVVQWSAEAVADLEEWERREVRDDKEDWIWDYRIRRAELEAMVNSSNEPERLWAITRLLQHAPKERVLELLTPADIEYALDRGDIDERTRRTWDAWLKYWRTK